MPKSRLLLLSLSILAVAVGVVFFSPFFVSNGLRWWVQWQARRQGLNAELGKINAPLLRPVAIQRVHVTNAHGAPFHIDLRAERAIVDLHLASIFPGTHGPVVHVLSLEGARAEVRHDFSNEAAKPELNWPVLQKLLPATFDLRGLDLRIENGATVIVLRNAAVSGSEIESGRFSAGELMIASPWFRQTFTALRGATKWQENRLTLGGISLAHGLDLQSMTTDFSRLGKQRADLQFDLDAFGGKIRASISNEWQSNYSNWNVAGAATGISLAQTSEALGFTDRLGGSLRACSFTFRGDPRDAMHGTASIWTELNGLTWRDRAADVIMLGVALYNRQIELQQLYVKQRQNQLTMSGEGSLSSKSPDWLSPDFRGDISGSIADLGEFAGLFGAAPGDFAGAIAIDGTLNTRERKIGGHLTASGASLSIFKTQIDKLTAKLNLKASELEIEQLELDRKKDFVHAHGKIDMSHEHDYSGAIEARISNAAEYFLFGRRDVNARPAPVELNATITSGFWDARVVVNLPGSSPINCAAKLPLNIGQDWKTFLASPLDVTVDFPAVFVANVPQFFHPEIFNDGILSGKISVSETLQHPCVTGDVQLLNAKLQNAPLDLTQANGRLTFAEDHATIDFLNAATRDVDLSFGGEIDFHDANDLVVKISSVAPIFDLTAGAPDCIRRIEIAPIGMTLAPAIEQFEFRGSLFAGAWRLLLKESGSTPPVPSVNHATRELRLCPEAEAGGQTFVFGAQPRATAPAARPRKHGKRR